MRNSQPSKSAREGTKGSWQMQQRMDAFTLTELMLAMAITAMLAVVMLSMLSGVLEHWQKTETRIDAYTDARGALKLIADELQDSVTMLAEKPAVVVDGAVNKRRLQFLTEVPSATQPENENQSDLCGVEYFLAPLQEGNGQALYRTLISSQTTFDRLSNGGTLFGSAPSTTNPNTELVAQNVVSFDVTLRDANYQPITDATTPAKYAEIALELIGRRNADNYFAANTSSALKAKILREQGRTFVQRTTL